MSERAVGERGAGADDPARARPPIAWGFTANDLVDPAPITSRFVDLHEAEFVLDELLRREAEQHGLGGGWR